MPTLAEELSEDPLDLGYAPLLTAANDHAVAALLNDTSGPGSGLVTVATMPKSDLLLDLIPAIAAISGMEDDYRNHWDRILAVLTSVESVRIANPGVQALFAAAVEDGLLTKEQAQAIGRRTGSRAEVLWGAGTVITPEQVGAAR